MKYFNNINSLDDLKNQFKKLARQYHPDAGGDAEVMKAINQEYDNLFPIWKHRYNATATEKTTETADSTRSQFYTQNGWEGSKHDWSRSTKEVAALIRSYVKEVYPTYKFSVRFSTASMVSELHTELKEAPHGLYKSFDELTREELQGVVNKAIRNRWVNESGITDEDLKKAYDEYDFLKVYNEVTQSMIQDVENEVKSYNYQDIDGMIDYFHVDFYYFGLKISNDFKIVEKQARIKNASGTEIKKTEQSENTANGGKKPHKYEIKESTHTKTGEKIWLVKIVDKLSREEYLEESSKMKELGGYYSRYTHSFIFDYNPEIELTNTVEKKEVEELKEFMSESDDINKTVVAIESTDDYVDYEWGFHPVDGQPRYRLVQIRKDDGKLIGYPGDMFLDFKSMDELNRYIEREAENIEIISYDEMVYKSMRETTKINNKDTYRKAKSENAEVEAVLLPDGWMWSVYPDGSGSLRSPEGERYLSFDMTTGELHNLDNKWEELKGNVRDIYVRLHYEKMVVDYLKVYEEKSKDLPNDVTILFGRDKRDFEMVKTSQAALSKDILIDGNTFNEWYRKARTAEERNFSDYTTSPIEFARHIIGAIESEKDEVVFEGEKFDIAEAMENRLIKTHEIVKNDEKESIQVSAPKVTMEEMHELEHNQTSQEKEVSVEYYTQNLDSTAEGKGEVRVVHQDFNTAMKAYFASGYDGKKIGVLIGGDDGLDIAQYDMVEGKDISYVDYIKNNLQYFFEGVSEQQLKDIIENMDMLNNTVNQSTVEHKKDVIMPDDTVSMQEMIDYGYTYSGMLPISKERVKQFNEYFQIFKLYEDGTEAMVMDDTELDTYDGMFGITLEDWDADKAKFLANVEKNTIKEDDNKENLEQIIENTQVRRKPMNIKITDMYIDKNYTENMDKGGRLATATLLIDDLFSIHGVNLMQGKNGMFLAMPSVKNSTGEYQNYAYFNNQKDREDITFMVMKECSKRLGREEPETKHISVNMFLEEKGNQKAYCTVVIDGRMNINRIRVMEGKNGLFVSMPKIKDKDGNYHDIISPASAEAYTAITDLVMKEYIKQSRQKTRQENTPSIQKGREKLNEARR